MKADGKGEGLCPSPFPLPNLPKEVSMNACICQGCENRFHGDDLVAVPVGEDETMLACGACARVACAQAHSDMGASMDEDEMIEILDGRWYNL